MRPRNPSTYLIPVFAALSLTPWMPAAAALVAGMILTLVFGNPYLETTKAYTHTLLTWSVVGLGFGLNLLVVARVGLHGLGYTVVGITVTLALGLALGKLFRLERDSAILISVGTAICGGSAIAAIAPVIRAKSHSMSIALGTVFLLNAIALLIFPPLGHVFHLNQVQFGLWSALAIHDTSSVVGSALQYGTEALKIATTVKLARALWIVPLTILASFVFAGSDEVQNKPKRPWFILGFVLAAAVVTWIPQAQSAGHALEAIAKRTLVLTLFFIGANLNRETLKAVGFMPLVQGFLLWLIVGIGTLAGLLLGWIH